MADLNGIGFQPSVSLPKIKQQIQEVVQEEQPQTSATQATNYQSADDVLGYMAKTSNFMDINPNKSEAAGAESANTETAGSSEAKATRKIEVSKYVTPEQAKRIAGFVQEFSSAVETGLKEFENEFGNMPEYQNMSNNAKMDVALNAFMLNNMPDAAAEVAV